jgi:hypothetical protein
VSELHINMVEIILREIAGTGVVIRSHFWSWNTALGWRALVRNGYYRLRKSSAALESSGAHLSSPYPREDRRCVANRILWSPLRYAFFSYGCF